MLFLSLACTHPDHMMFPAAFHKMGVAGNKTNYFAKMGTIREERYERQMCRNLLDHLRIHRESPVEE